VTPEAVAPLRLPSDLQSIFQQSYPRFSDAEYAHRHAGIARAMEANPTLPIRGKK
jgi:hypothetical protein